MNEDSPSPEDLDELRRRWEADATPQLSLKLAEEYGRSGQVESAISVLETALESHPDHVAARVAMGRYLMEIGRHQDARSVLEAVVNEDPVHLVANKALVRLYADIGEEHKAKDRLDLYKILAESDPQIEELEHRVRGEMPPEPDREAEPGVDDPHQAKPRPDDGGSGLESSDPRWSIPASTGQELFVGLAARVGVAEYWDAVGSEGIFPVHAAPVATAVAVEPEHGAASDSVAELDVVAGGELEADVATVTMANLYLEQGHLEDAEKTYREVLAADPNNEQAAAGLSAVLDQRGELADESVESRKIGMLRDYLERLRASSKGN